MYFTNSENKNKNKNKQTTVIRPNTKFTNSSYILPQNNKLKILKILITQVPPPPTFSVNKQKFRTKKFETRQILKSFFLKSINYKAIKFKISEKNH